MQLNAIKLFAFEYKQMTQLDVQFFRKDLRPRRS